MVCADLFPKSRRVYWKTYLLIAVVSACAFALLYGSDAFEKAYELSRHYEAWQLDELFSFFVIATFALIATLVVHERHLRAALVERKQAERQAENASRYDGLTGIPNRMMFQEEFARGLERAKATRTRLAVRVIDIDGFFAVNDAWGHTVGDGVLREVAERLRGVLRKGDLVARLGSDEFVVLFPMVTEQTDDLFRLATRILAVLREPFVCGDREVELTGSIGIAKYPRDGDQDTVLLQRAENAMMQAKSSGKNRYALYDAGLEACRRQRLAAESDLRDGLERGEIVAHYQPLVDLATMRPRGFEALARWQHPTRGLLGAPEFIPIVEDAGLSERLFTAMLQRVCLDTKDWAPDLTVAINLSPPQLLDSRLADHILALLADMGVPPQRIEIEITETALLLDFDTARRTMSALREAGVRMSLDDFGTGYSGLRHLRELPIDKIKVDRSFTQRIVGDPQCRKIITSMLHLGSALGMTTVAEGVEAPQEADWLRSQGCHLGQGYLFARPLPPEEALGLGGLVAL
ncbi:MULTISPECIES: putative bifunctional diguanylate cyclase/phosphodiesterase [unclassified Xanthobacter]|uniref:putative bifunctional diguanylate cyclase/phosphodiesterase n=1 Tax=unclassified Xanthobacter TaxID=2623496 RepID=UPI001EE089B3|nr:MULTISPECIES: EAL domain-containing protein [unclassified Xanthobacter]